MSAIDRRPVHGSAPRQRSHGRTRRPPERGPVRLAWVLAALLALTGCGTSAPTSVQGGSAVVAPAASPSASASAGQTSSASPGESESASGVAPVRIALSGRGPLGMAIDGVTAWVVTTDSGHLISLDLMGRRETAATEIGTGGTHVVVGADDAVLIGRFASGGQGEHLVIVDSSARTVDGVATGALGGLAAGDDRTVWALEKSGSVLHVDPTARRVVGRTPVTVDANTHMELVTGAGARWASSDETPVRRIGSDGSVVATIETGGGIPLAFAAGRVWGARADELWAIDPATNAIALRVRLVDIEEILALDVAVDGREAWIAARRPGRVGTVVRIDLPSGRLVTEHRVSLPAAVELTRDRAWVTSYDTNEVLGFAR